MAGPEVRPASGLALDRLDDRGVAVAQEEGAVPHPVVHILVPIDVPLPASPGVGDVKRERREVTDIVGDPAGDRAAGPRPEGPRARVKAAIGLEDAHGLTLIPAL